MKREQADLERQLWDERQGIQKKQEEKVKIARTKCVLDFYLPASQLTSFVLSFAERAWLGVG